MTLTPQSLVDTYRQIAEERMQDMPFFNTALQVEAVGFRAWEEHQVGVLITPWFMNLVLIPGPEEEWRDFSSDKARAWEFPSGSCEFHASRPDGKASAYVRQPVYDGRGFPRPADRAGCG